jgi:hypothetical protein
MEKKKKESKVESDLKRLEKDMKSKDEEEEMELKDFMTTLKKE